MLTPSRRCPLGELQSLDAFRLEVVRFQKRVTDAQTVADSTMRKFADLKKAAAADSAKLTPALTSQLADVDKVLSTFTSEIGATPAARAAQFAGRAPGAGAAAPPSDDMEDENRGASGAPDMSFSGRAGTLNSVIGSNFAVSSAQRALLQKLGKEIDAQSAAVAKVKATSLPALSAALTAAGVKVP
ncbi:hypothetical protein [Gemmatimonas sp.]|uniref:hypothetical protein n=1 Tax=Gemmatimonas sp. TaxID=1962908 RepID=UPI003DA4E128